MKPSYIKDELYELANNYRCGSDTYDHEVVEAIVDFFDNKYPQIQCNWYDYNCGDFGRGVFCVAWIEVDQLHTEAFAWKL